jgi:hypothetical protein
MTMLRALHIAVALILTSHCVLAQPVMTTLPLTAEAISGDGRVVVGGVGPMNGTEAGLWSLQGGLVQLTFDPGHPAKATAANGDGSVVAIVRLLYSTPAIS